jgi:hypothetical protein
MLKRVDRGTHISLVPMAAHHAASWIPRDARSRWQKARDEVTRFFREAELAEVVAHGLLLGLVLYATFVALPKI